MWTACAARYKACQTAADSKANNASKAREDSKVSGRGREFNKGRMDSSPDRGNQASAVKRASKARQASAASHNPDSPDNPDNRVGTNKPEASLVTGRACVRADNVVCAVATVETARAGT